MRFQKETIFLNVRQPNPHRNWCFVSFVTQEMTSDKYHSIVTSCHVAYRSPFIQPPTRAAHMRGNDKRYLRNKIKTLYYSYNLRILKTWIMKIQINNFEHVTPCTGIKILLSVISQSSRYMSSTQRHANLQPLLLHRALYTIYATTHMSKAGFSQRVPQIHTHE